MTDRDKRALRLGLVALILVFVMGRVIPANRRWSARERSIADSAVIQLARAKRIVVAGSHLSRVLETHRARFRSVRPMLLTADDATDASVSLARAVRSAADSSGLLIANLQLETDTADTGLQLIHVDLVVDGVGDLRQLTSFLVQLERQPLETSVRSMSITKPDPGVSEAPAEKLRVSMVVEGLALTRGELK